MKGVASAVGEGSAIVQMIHEYLKDEHDPANLFRVNQNIKPAV